MALKFKVEKKSSNAGLPTSKTGNVRMVLNKDIKTWPAVSADKTTYEGNWEFHDGENMGEVYMTASTQALTSEPGGNPDGMGSKNKFVGEHPGTAREVMAFIKKYANEGFILFSGGCGSKEYRVIGSQCNPVKLSPSIKDDKDGNVTTLTFEQEQLNDDYVMFYYGDLPTSEPHTVVSNSFALEKAKGQVYKLPANEDDAETAITITASDLDADTMVTFVGGGGSEPLVLSNATAGAVGIITKNGSAWTELAGAKIHLRVVKGDKTYLVETSRS